MSATSRETIRHLVRTLILVFLASAGFSVLFLGMMTLGLHPGIIFTVLGIAVAALVYSTARWHPWWAPIAKRVTRIPWQREDGMEMETVVERAQVEAGTVTREYYRVSIYEGRDGRRVQRTVVGDDASYLGVFDSGIWFYIEDAFYARRDGLASMDPRTGLWKDHWPKKTVQLADEDARVANGVIDLVWDGVPVSFDLNRGTRTQ